MSNNPLTLKELQEAYDNSSENGLHIWIYDLETDWLVAGIVDEWINHGGLVGVYSADDPSYTEANYGKEWVAYLERPEGVGK